MHYNLVLITYHLNAHTNVASKNRSLNVGLSLYLRPKIVYASNKGFGGSVLLCRPSLLDRVIRTKFSGPSLFTHDMRGSRGGPLW